jgi:hypothetical protein
MEFILIEGLKRWAYGSRLGGMNLYYFFYFHCVPNMHLI